MFNLKISIFIPAFSGLFSKSHKEVINQTDEDSLFFTGAVA